MHICSLCAAFVILIFFTQQSWRSYWSPSVALRVVEGLWCVIIITFSQQQVCCIHIICLVTHVFSDPSVRACKVVSWIRWFTSLCTAHEGACERLCAWQCPSSVAMPVARTAADREAGPRSKVTEKQKSLTTSIYHHSIIPHLRSQSSAEEWQSYQHLISRKNDSCWFVYIFILHMNTLTSWKLHSFYVDIHPFSLNCSAALWRALIVFGQQWSFTAQRNKKSHALETQTTLIKGFFLLLFYGMFIGFIDTRQKRITRGFIL